MNYVSSLVEKREEVWRELEALRAEQRLIGERLGVKEAQLRNIDELLALEGRVDAPRSAGDELRAGITFLDNAVELLRSERSGLHYKAMLERLNGNGVNVPGRDPAANLLAHLGRDDRFVRVGRGTYGLKGKHKALRPRSRSARGRIIRKKKMTGS